MDDSATGTRARAGEVTTIIVDVGLRGGGELVEVFHPEPGMLVVRVRVYVQADAGRDLWTVVEPDTHVVAAGAVMVAGPEGPARVVISAVEQGAA